jgi:hypothetical protein
MSALRDFSVFPRKVHTAMDDPSLTRRASVARIAALTSPAISIPDHIAYIGTTN